MNQNTNKCKYFAIVDLGSNAIRFDVYQTPDFFNNEITLIKKERLLPKLARFSHSTLPESELSKLLTEFQKYNKIINNFQNIEVLAVGTEIFRTITNTEQIIALLSQALSYPIRILSGKEEAEYTVLGINSFEKNLPSNSIYVDIGGGSTEISWYDSNNILQSKSFPIGAFQLNHEYNLKVPLLTEQYQLAKNYISGLINTLDFNLNPYSTLIGSSGTIKALNYLYQKIYLSPPPDSTLASDFPQKIITSLSEIKNEEVENYLGEEFHRKEMLAGGICILESILSCIEINKIRYTRYSLRHGLLAKSLFENFDRSFFTKELSINDRTEK